MNARVIRPRQHQERRGAAAVELALMMPILMLMLLGMVEVGMLVNAKQLLSNAAREGGRQASTAQRTVAEVEQVVRDYLRNAGLRTSNVSVAVSNLTSPASGTKGALQFDRIEVVVTVPFEDIRLLDAHIVTSPSTTITGRAVWFSMKDRPYPSAPEPPIE
jgi:Flp pilus assembly protein TadG